MDPTNLIILFIAGMFVSNMLGRSVAERRMEFGTLRALGMPGRTILFSVAAEALRYLDEPRRYEGTRAALHDVLTQLGAPGASGRAADAVLEVARTRMGSGVI